MLDKRTQRIATKAVLAAGKYVAQHYGKLEAADFTLKKKHERVTKVDIDSNNMIIRQLVKYFPNDDILSEESPLSDKPGTRRWVIDPIDGTSNFIAHIPLFAVSLALMHDADVLWSMTYAPILNEKFIAAEGSGVTLNGKSVHVSSRPSVAGSMLAYGYSHEPSSKKRSFHAMERFSDHASSMRHLGSASLELAYVACGRFDASIFFSPLKIWDVAAGVLQVKEAGGAITQHDGKSWTPDSTTLVASNKKMHVEILQKLA